MLEPTIGIEVHVELKSNAKVFSKSKNTYDNLPNIYVNEVDLGYPGTLPSLNKEVIDMALKAALALNCKINTKMHFDRKNYFYPDLPKGYQITQKDTPIGYDGYLPIEVDGKVKNIGIERIHIEEDTCKSIHSIEGTLLNFNRSGVPLIEIVSKPVMHDAKEAVSYLENLRLTLLHLGISDVKIEEGSMRCDANVSLGTKDALGAKTEIKNIGSISNVGLSINFEIKRQKELLEKGLVVTEETRRFDDKTKTTVLMRTKETGNDYRYLPEPDIPYVEIDEKWLSEAKSSLPKLPDALKKEYQNLNVNGNALNTLLNNLELTRFFEAVKEKCNPEVAANLLTGEILSYMNKEKKSLSELKLTNDNFIEVVNNLSAGKISSKQAKELLNVIFTEGGNTLELIKSLGMSQVSDEASLRKIILDVLKENPASIEDFKAGKDRAIKYLMGQVMKASRGQANPVLANQILLEELKK